MFKDACMTKCTDSAAYTRHINSSAVSKKFTQLKDCRGKLSKISYFNAFIINQWYDSITDTEFATLGEAVKTTMDRLVEKFSGKAKDVLTWIHPIMEESLGTRINIEIDNSDGDDEDEEAGNDEGEAPSPDTVSLSVDGKDNRKVADQPMPSGDDTKVSATALSGSVSVVPEGKVVIGEDGVSSVPFTELSGSVSVVASSESQLSSSTAPSGNP